jgi:hypothetical protein
MSLADLIYPKRKPQVATATRAAPATREAVTGPTVATVATVAVAKSKTVEAANDPESIPADCVGALLHPDGGLYLPWGPRQSSDEVRQIRGELVAIIEELCSLECWPEQHRDDVLTRATRGPLADMMPNLCYFAERLEAAQAASAALRALDSRAWHCEGLEARHYCPSCDGSCVGTRRSCKRAPSPSGWAVQTKST